MLKGSEDTWKHFLLMFVNFLETWKSPKWIKLMAYPLLLLLNKKQHPEVLDQPWEQLQNCMIIYDCYFQELEQHIASSQMKK